MNKHKHKSVPEGGLRALSPGGNGTMSWASLQRRHFGVKDVCSFRSFRLHELCLAWDLRLKLWEMPLNEDQVQTGAQHRPNQRSHQRHPEEVIEAPE